MPDEEVRVSTLELFFDLVFVFTITQLTGMLAREPTWTGLARAALIFGNVWWMYGGYAWLANAVPPRGPVLRLLMLGGMAGFLVVALSIPDAFGSGGVAFGLGYLLVTLVHFGLFLRSTEGDVPQAVRRLGPFNGVTALLLLAAGFVDDALQWLLWTAGFVLHWSTPYVTGLERFRVRSRHFVERHGLIVLIALGESIVALGLGVEEGDLRPSFLLTAVLGLALASALWWLYFDGEDERAERTLAAADPTRGPWLALHAFGTAFLPVLGGIVVLAAGLELGIAHAGDELAVAAAWLLGGGVALHLLGLAWFRRLLHAGPVAVRLTMAALALATAAAGIAVSPTAQLALLVALLIGGILVESRVPQRV